VQRLSDAIVQKDLNAIDAAMDLVADCGSLTAEAAAKVSQAQSAKKLITAQFMLKGDLNKALESKDQKAVASLLSRATELNLDKAEAAKAQAWLTAVDTMKKGLITAVNGAQIKKIEEVLVKEAFVLGCKTDTDVVMAIAQLEKLKKTVANLRDQINKRELGGMEFAVQQAVKQGLNMDATVNNTPSHSPPRSSLLLAARCPPSCAGSRPSSATSVLLTAHLFGLLCAALAVRTGD
jgi:hypothetical protein